MASLPPVVVSNTVKLDPEFKKLSPPSLQFVKKNYSTKELLSKASGSSSLELTEAVEGNRNRKQTHFVGLLQECLEKESVTLAESIHAQIIKLRPTPQLIIMTSLVNVYSKFGMMDSAVKVFDNMPERNVVTWTSLMGGYVHNSEPVLAINVFNKMLAVGVCPNVFSLGIVLNACTSLSDIRLAQQLHGYIMKYGLVCDTTLGISLCGFYSKNGTLDMAMNAHRMITEKNVFSWTAAISACRKNEDYVLGLNMFVDMLDEGVEPNTITFTGVLGLCYKVMAIDLGLQVYASAIKLGYGSESSLINSIMHMYLKSGRLAEAIKLFDAMNTTSVPVWNALIAGHAEMVSHAEDTISASLYGVEGLQIFERMNRSGLKPSAFTFSSVLCICSNLVALEQGEQVHSQMIKTGFISNVVVGGALLTMYNKCGSIDRASKAFVEMSERTVITWTSMINAFARHGHSQQAIQLFEDMIFVGVQPTKITFVCVLSACSDAGMVNEALAYYDLMKKKYKIDPWMDHNACIIDMFVKLRQIDEAFNFIKKMDITPDEFIWLILIAGCKSQGKLELGIYAAEQLLQLGPKDPESYFVIYNLYVRTGRREDASKVRKMMKDKKIEGITDWSWISIRDKVYSFKSGEKKHQSDEVAKFLEDLTARARVLGYRGRVEIGEKGPAGSQSVKLAVAFGLMKTSKEAEIRIRRRIGMCGDSHYFLKVVSKLTSRNILVTAGQRMHKFSNGKCSCEKSGGFV